METDSIPFAIQSWPMDEPQLASDGIGSRSRNEFNRGIYACMDGCIHGWMDSLDGFIGCMDTLDGFIRWMDLLDGWMDSLDGWM